jgi:hypothetical protein
MDNEELKIFLPFGYQLSAFSSQLLRDLVVPYFEIRHIICHLFRKLSFYHFRIALEEISRQGTRKGKYSLPLFAPWREIWILFNWQLL